MAGNCQGQMRAPRSPLFPPPPCPCMKCKIRAQELQIARGLAAINSGANASNICDKSRARRWAEKAACDDGGLNSNSYGFRGAYAADQECSCGAATMLQNNTGYIESGIYAPSKGGAACGSCKTISKFASTSGCRCVGAGNGLSPSCATSIDKTGIGVPDARGVANTGVTGGRGVTNNGVPEVRGVTNNDASCKSRPNMRGPVGVNIFGNEQVNFFITFIMEFMGILVFFAVCTVTFWMTIGYYIVGLLVDLKNADRNVQVAVLVVVSLLLIAFAITLMTNQSGPCPHNKKAAGSWKAKTADSKSKMAGSSKSKTAAVKPKMAGICKSKTGAGCKARTTGQKAGLVKSFFKKANFVTNKKANAKSSAGCGKCLNIKAIIGGFQPRRTYTDCEGRGIFQNWRRYSIPSEMKQPPTLLVWINDYIVQHMESRT